MGVVFGGLNGAATLEGCRTRGGPGRCCPCLALEAEEEEEGEREQQWGRPRSSAASATSPAPGEDPCCCLRRADKADGAARAGAATGREFFKGLDGAGLDFGASQAKAAKLALFTPLAGCCCAPSSAPGCGGIWGGLHALLAPQPCLQGCRSSCLLGAFLAQWLLTASSTCVLATVTAPGRLRRPVTPTKQRGAGSVGKLEMASEAKKNTKKTDGFGAFYFFSLGC